MPKADFADPEKLAQAIKDLPIPLLAARPLKEAISSAGGEAPTGGYLLTACFATGRAAGLGAIQFTGA